MTADSEAREPSNPKHVLCSLDELVLVSGGLISGLVDKPI